MDASKIISVIVPCYNVERCVSRCLDSLLSQDIGLDALQIVCVDDGSTDGTAGVLESYRQANPEAITVLSGPNRGAARARMDGVSAAQGVFIGFLDADDYAEPALYSRLLETARSQHAQIAVCGYRRVDAESGAVVCAEFVEQRAPIIVEEEPERLLEVNTAPWNKVFAATCLKRAVAFQDYPTTFEDVVMHLLAYPEVRKIAFVAEPLVDYSVHADSLITNVDLAVLRQIADSFVEVKRAYSDGPVFRDARFVLDALAFEHLGISLMFRLSCNPQVGLGQALQEGRAVLDGQFPTWKSDAIINKANARKYGGALKKTWLARLVYKAHLMRPALGVYRWMIARGKDIKW